MLFGLMLALHIFSVIYWIGGLLMITSLLSEVPGEVGLPKERFLGAAQRLFEIITHIGAAVAIGSGVVLIALHPQWIKENWMHLKLLLVAILLFYHVRFYRRVRFLEDNPSQTSHWEYSIVHVTVSLLVLAILMLTVLKPF
jgi:protoporphyrinogen IX oxidase